MTREGFDVAVPGATLAGDRWSGSGPVVVLLHAGVCDRRCWRDAGDRLAAAGRAVAAYDRRGYGDVPPAAAPFRHVDDLIAVLDAVSPDAPAWLVGSSMGGGVALDAALDAPRRVAGLVLLAPAVSGEAEPDDDAYVAATNGLAEAIDEAWTAGDLERCNRLEVHVWLDGPGCPEGRVGGAARELALEMNRIVLANERRLEEAGVDGSDGASAIDAAGRLHEVAAPATVACGELDLTLKLEGSAALARALPRATYRSLPGRAHLPYLEDPDETAALILAAAA